MKQGRRLRYRIGVSLVALGVGAAALWAMRLPIATHFVDREIARRGVPIRYRIADLGLRSQRLTDVVIGDPAHPDLVADRIDLTTDIGLDGARVSAIRLGQVRLRARIADGRLQLGAIDKLLPPPSGKPFALPAIWIGMEDARIHLETPAGTIGIKLRGQGRADNGFTGKAALIAERLETNGCGGTRLAGLLNLRVSAGQPMVAGPLRAAAVACQQVRAQGVVVDLDAHLNDRIDRWQGTARLAADRVDHPRATLRALGGTIGFDGGPARTAGDVDLRAAALAAPEVAAGAASLSGTYRIGKAGVQLDARLQTHDTRLAAPMLARIAEAGRGGAGMPVVPLVVSASAAARAAAARFDLSTRLRLDTGAGETGLSLSDLEANSASGARLTFAHGEGVGISPAGVRLDGLLALSGGGLPEAVLRVTQARAGGPVRGTGFVRPYAAGDARLALADLDITAAGGGTRISTTAELSGPLAGGRIERARLPLAIAWNGAGSVRVNPACAPLRFDQLRLSGLTLGATQLQLCPAGAALVTVAGGRVAGGARVDRLALAGRSGGAPVTIAAQNVRYDLASNGFTATSVATRLGEGDAVTRIDLAAIDGSYRAGMIAGHFNGGAGQIGKVPLLMSAAAGDWQLQDGKLALHGGLTVADADAEPRFRPLTSQDVALTFYDGQIAATGALIEPQTGTHVTDVAIAHDLNKGNGHADLAVPGIAFTEGFQPERLTRLTYGVIAAVRGSVSGAGRIDWTREGVTSHGRFATEGIDLAAAFGPVTGLKGAIDFTDLLNLESAPGQEIRLAQVNPGVPVENGIVRLQLLAGQRVRIESGEWPFAGGRLVLAPTLLDLGEHAERRLTFAVHGVDAAQFLKQLDFKNLNATGTFDGVLPMIFNARGGRIENGSLIVREGGGEIAYVGPISQKDLGFWGNTAFQALKSLRYRRLAIAMNGPIAGEMVTEVRFAGVTQGTGAKTNFLIRRLQRLPFVFNVRITAPFRQLLESAVSLYDPQRLIERNLPALIDAQNEAVRKAEPVQPPASEPVPKGEPK